MIKVTNDRSNLTRDRIAAAHGSFNRIRQVVLVCTPWRHYTRLLGSTGVCTTKGISIGSAAFAGLNSAANTQTDRQTHRRKLVKISGGLEA